MEVRRSATVVDKDGLRGEVIDPSARSDQGERQVLLQMEDGRQVMAPVDLLSIRKDGSYYLPVSIAQTETNELARDRLVVPVVEEELVIGKRTIQSGGLRLTKHVREREEVVDEAGFDEEVQVERVPVNRILETPVSIRQEGDVLIVPLMEEILVVEKRLVLKEELRVTKHRNPVKNPQRVTLRREEVTIERMDPVHAE